MLNFPFFSTTSSMMKSIDLAIIKSRCLAMHLSEVLGTDIH